MMIQFDNWYQHDSQEFLSYLLSCLHEDCNRNLQKPYEAVKDYDSAKQTEEEYFNYCKKLMLRREDSKITDLFSGITRMSIKCPNEGCKYEALKFEQFNMLTLPLYKRKNQVEAEEFHMMSNEGIYTLHKRTVCYSKGMTIKDTLAKINNLEKSLEAYPYNFYRYNEKNKSLARVTDTDQNLDYLHRNGEDLLLIIQDTAPALPPDESQENDIFLKFKVKDSRVTGFSKPLFTSKRTSVQSLYRYVFGMTRLIAEKEFQVASFETYFPEPVKAAEEKIKTEDNPEEVGSEKNNTAQTSSTKGTTAEVTKQPNNKHMFTLSIINSDGTKTLIEYLPNQTLDDIGRGDSSLTLEISYRFKDLLDLKGLGVYQIERSADKLELVESRKGHQSIYDCLEGFIEDETLDQYNAWNCPKCKTRVKAELATTLQETPQLLIIHLKRFKKEGFTRKISDVIDFPIKGLELERFTSSSAKPGQSVYDLYAITNHYGDTGGGHYTAFGKDLNLDKWYQFDDGSVNQVRSANWTGTHQVGVGCADVQTK